MIACVRRRCVDVACDLRTDPENLREHFAKSEDMRGQTRSFGAQTEVFNANSCPLKLGTSAKPSNEHATSTPDKKRKVTNSPTPLDTYFSMSHSQAFQTQGDTPPHKANAIL